MTDPARFDYAEMTQRNLGFVSAAEQARLRSASVFVVGTGGMGGACLQSLVRAGVGRFEIADIDVFEVSNLNRQVFASLSDVGERKATTTRRKILDINPEAQVVVYGEDWIDALDEILPRCKTVVNGMDDIQQGIVLYRKARAHGATVIDAYTSPLPSVVVVRPGDPLPEERLGFPTVGLAPTQFTPELIAECRAKEIEYVMVHSSSAEAIDLDVAADVIAGRRPRMSFAPMVIATGTMMANEAISALLARRSGADFRGYFLNQGEGRIERPKPLVHAMVRTVGVRAAMGAMARAGSLRIREQELKDFFEVPFNAYGEDSPYVSLFSADLERFLDEKANPLFARFGERTYFTAYRGDKPLGRITAHIHHASNTRYNWRRAYFGFFDCANDPVMASELLQRAEAWGLAHGCDEIWGNVNLTAMQQIGVVTGGYEHAPYSDMVYNPPHIAELLEKNGYERTFPMSTTELRLADIDEERLIGPKHRELLRHPDYEWTTVRRRHLNRQLGEALELLNAGFHQNPMFVPLSDEEFRFQAKDLMWVIDERLSAVVYRDRTPLGITICIPDLNPLLKRLGSRLSPLAPWHFVRYRRRCDRAVGIFYSVRPEAHSLGVGTAMLYNVIKALKQAGYKTWGATWISDENKASLGPVTRLGFKPLHRLHLFKKALR